MSDTRDALQRALGDAFTITRELGGGGMSRVFLAHEAALGRDVVVKLLSPETSSLLSVERFTREIRTAAALQEPHIVPVLMAGETPEGLPWFTMPFVAGESLRARLSRGALPAGEALGILRNVAQALAYAHARGVVHRDIKPENVLLSNGTAVVADFGIAKALDASRTQVPGGTLTGVGMAVGTPAYMSPEQAMADPATDHRTDIYAWGVLAYELLAGAHPFADKATPSAMTAAHLTERPRPIPSDAITRPVQALVLQALEKDPGARPQSMDEVLHALAMAGTGAQGGGSPASARPQLPRAALAVLTLGALAVAGWLTRTVPTRRADAKASAPSVAVLPFSVLGGGAESAYLGDGIAETLISALGRVPGLVVAARTSAFAFRGKDVDVREIGGKLGVATVLEGSVQRAGDQLRITAQLVGVQDGVSLWSQTFDRNAGDIFAVQDEVARAVVTALTGTVREGAGGAAKSQTSDPVAYDLYLQGRYHANTRRAQELARGVALLQQALARDSTFAAAWSGLADAYTLQGLYSDTAPQARFRLAMEAAERAVRLAPENGEALASRGYARLLKDWDWAGAEADLSRAIQASPSYALGHKWYADLLRSAGRDAEAFPEYQRTLQLDPLSATLASNLSATYAAMADTAKAAEWMNRALQLDPDHPTALRVAVLKWMGEGDSVRFFDGQQRLEANSVLAGAPVTTLRAAWQAGGIPAVRRAQVAAFEQQRQYYEAARWYADAGDLDGTFRALNATLDARLAWAPHFQAAFPQPEIRRDPRYAALVRRLGLPEPRR